MKSFRIGIDLGGTKTELLVLDEKLTEILRFRRQTPSESYTDIVDNLVSMVQQAEKEVGQQCQVGIGMPGSISPVTGNVRNSNTVCMNGMPLKEDLETRLAREVRLANDANCFALSEATDGAGAGARSVFGVIIGTGCGGGVVINGQLLQGHNHVAGEWGHNPLPWPTREENPGEQCYCGQHGCLETWISGTGFQRHWTRETGLTETAIDIIRKVESGDEAAEKALSDYESRLARALSAIVNIVDPEVIVLGGGMSNIGRLYSTVPQKMRQWVFSDCLETRILAPTHGDSSGVRGAACLW